MITYKYVIILHIYNVHKSVQYLYNIITEKLQNMFNNNCKRQTYI